MQANLPTSAFWRSAPAAVLFGGGALLLVHGFVSTEILQAGLRATWQPAGVWRFATFLLTTLGVALVAARFGRNRTPLLLLGAIWLGMAFGIGAVASVALIAASALGLGWRITRGAAFADGDPLEVALLRGAAGLVLIVATVQVAVHFPINTQASHLLLLCAALGLGRGGLCEAAVRLRGYCCSPIEPGRPLYATTVLLVVLAVHSVVAALPEVGSDALAMHVVVAQQVVSQKQWSFDFLAYCWALCPMGADWLYTTAWLLGGEAAARLCNFALLVSIALLVRGQVRRSLPGPLASLLVAGCAAAPIVFLESSSLWVENLLTLFLISAALIAARCWDRAGSRDVAAFVLCAGGALMTKSLGLLGLPLVAGLAWKVATSAAPVRLRVARITLGLASLVAVGGLPYLYAYGVSGNPLFPFFNDIFGSPYYADVRFVDTRWVGHGGFGLLYRLTFLSSVYGELYDGAFGFQHLLLLPLGLIVALLRWPRGGRAVLAATALVVALSLVGTQYIRYLYALLWAAAMIEAEALGTLLDPPWLKRASLTIVCLACCANLAFMPAAYYLLRGFPIEAVFSRRARERFVHDEAPYRRLNEVVNATAGSRARVLYVGAPYGAFLEGVPVYTNWYNLRMYSRVRLAESAEMVTQVVADERITHVAIEDDPDLPVWRQWLSLHARRMLSLAGADLYEIESPPSEPAP